MTPNPIPCRTCGAMIIFIETQNGHKMPCNVEAVEYQSNYKGTDTIVTEEGKVIRGTIVGQAQQIGLLDKVVDGKGYIPHWATCPTANEHRKKLKEGQY